MPASHDTGRLFSDELASWLKASSQKTVGGLQTEFGDKTFALIFLLLMAIPALPVPTGGITHVFEVIVIILAVEYALNMKTIWLPDSLKRVKLGKTTTVRIVPFLMRRIRFLERYSRRRGNRLMDAWPGRLVTGLIIIVYALAAATAIPFSGLDTLPALGIVIMALGLLLDDIVIVLAGIVVGIGGIALIISIGLASLKAITHLF